MLCLHSFLTQKRGGGTWLCISWLIVNFWSICKQVDFSFRCIFFVCSFVKSVLLFFSHCWLFLLENLQAHRWQHHLSSFSRPVSEGRGAIGELLLTQKKLGQHNHSMTSQTRPSLTHCNALYNDHRIKDGLKKNSRGQIQLRGEGTPSPFRWEETSFSASNFLISVC